MRKKFGRDYSFVAYSLDGYLIVFCGGGTAFGVKFNKWFELDNWLESILNADEDEVIAYAKENHWYYYDYTFTNCLVDKSGNVIETMSKTYYESLSI